MLPGGRRAKNIGLGPLANHLRQVVAADSDRSRPVKRPAGKCHGLNFHGAKKDLLNTNTGYLLMLVFLAPTHSRLVSASSRDIGR